MTLKDRFKVISCSDCDMPYCDIKCTNLSEHELDKLEKIADDYAMEFAFFVGEHIYSSYSDGTWSNDFGDENLTTKQLLEIFKKQKGL